MQNKNRSTNSAAFCAIHWMPFKPPFPFYATQIINPFLIQGSQPITRGNPFLQNKTMH